LGLRIKIKIKSKKKELGCRKKDTKDYKKKKKYSLITPDNYYPETN